LLVEDELELRQLIADELRLHGATVMESGDAVQAAELLKTTKMDVLITDLHLPNGGGRLILETINAKALKLKKIIVISGQSTDQHLHYGVSDLVWLNKPFRLNQLIACLVST
jgi:DNA-binding response OmpR family regulator